jgi:hypothetical protein
MKILTSILILAIFTSFQNRDEKSLLIGKWKQFAFKANGAKEVLKTDEDCANKKSIFNKDGTYSEDMYCLKSGGKWYLNSDRSKLCLTLNNFNGTVLPESTDTTKSFNIIILRLTEDTLIYGTEGYYGENKVYGHDDWYFVRVQEK